jgi:DNA-binding transcriptional LysR family regulator
LKKHGIACPISREGREMELAQLEAFLEATYWGSIRRAAEALFLSQPSLSERIKKLETEMGQPLFHRMGRGVRLTEAGKNLLPFAQQAVQALRQGREALQAMHPRTGGMLHVGSARAVGTYVLPEVIAKFHQHYGVDVHMRSGRSSEVLQMVLKQEVQVGVARALVHPEVQTIPLYDEVVVLVTHSQHPFALVGQASIYDVAKEPLILYDRDSFYFVLINRVCQEAGIIPNVLMMLDSIEATKQMVERGLGISFLPGSSIRREVKLGAIAHVPLAEGYRVVLGTVAMVLRKQPRSPETISFLRLLREELDSAPSPRRVDSAMASVDS